MFKPNPLSLIDFYKADHASQYPEGTEYVYSNLTPRSDRLAPVLKQFWDGRIVVFGIQGFIKEVLIDYWQEEFFWKNKTYIVTKFKSLLDKALGPDAVSVVNLEELWELGYLPIRVKALPEGSLCPIKVPVMTIVNTNPRFGWLTNRLETLISSELWHPMTSATIAFQYRKLLEHYAEVTGGSKEFVKFQAHDFSFRGLAGWHAAAKSGAAHLLSFNGTDTVHSIEYLEEYYRGDLTFIGGSIPATEHSVMSMGGKETEYETYERLITEVYPKGLVSIVSDTWDYWKVLVETLPALKEKILARNGKLVVRPDSGDPVKIIVGDPGAPVGSAAYHGSIQTLWDTFGGTVNELGFKELDPHVGLIYGDSITLERAYQILEGLLQKGFCSSNVVFGVGSFTYQYVTRDSFGFAMKATWGCVNGKAIEISKDPATDTSGKKSAVGLLRVELNGEDGTLSLKDHQTEEEEKGGVLQTVFEDGTLLSEESLGDIRERLESYL
jgi:nicotinamide phosphoribosyltransferase